ncbi:DNA cytosine methyltransferase [Geminocystis sp. NIES-3709]|uniref:DNA cytosine methyltransferase n=1 Tax=Geminocystis sp. NIES-3709 TaxID=1617448 RepID=UPI0005FC4E52|nr:DNA cytosine methyltransferase [Geminocystis sp. NIES-3709]BAQ66625.1 DNA-cytosine methyltransferase [Geminocystis sp. NIES-3709]
MSYKFIDLFAGIGGFRLGFEKVGFQCVFSSKIDSHAREIYFNNFEEIPAGDIREIDIKTIPNFDILLAGFLCQLFNIDYTLKYPLKAKQMSLLDLGLLCT